MASATKVSKEPSLANAALCPDVGSYDCGQKSNIAKCNFCQVCMLQDSATLFGFLTKGQNNRFRLPLAELQSILIAKKAPLTMN